MIYILAGILGVGIILYAMIAAPKTEEEQRMEDEAQLEYLRQWRENHRL